MRLESTSSFVCFRCLSRLGQLQERLFLMLTGLSMMQSSGPLFVSCGMNFMLCLPPYIWITSPLGKPVIWIVFIFNILIGILCCSSSLPFFLHSVIATSCSKSKLAVAIIIFRRYAPTIAAQLPWRISNWSRLVRLGRLWLLYSLGIINKVLTRSFGGWYSWRSTNFADCLAPSLFNEIGVGPNPQPSP